MPISYENGKIYRIVCPDNQYYIGSTTSSLDERLRQHKMHAKQNPRRKLFTTINSFGWDAIEIELVENYPCKSKKELISREDYFIQQAKNDDMCLNINRAYVTKEEKAEAMKSYYESHKEEIKEKHKEYYANPEIKERTDEYQAEYRKKNAEKRRAYSKKYAEEHPDETKAARKVYYEQHKEEILEKMKSYVKKNKEKIQERKRQWALKKKDETKDIILAEREQRNQERKAKSQAKKAEKEQVQQCECGGTYQPYRKSRHDKGKKHIQFLEATHTAPLLREVPK